MNEPIRIAQVMGKMISGGVESVVMNYYRNIDHSKVQFDFIVDEDSTHVPKEEIESLGGRVIVVPPYQKIFKYLKELKRVFKENNYRIVHSHLNALSVFPLYAAKSAKVKVRIAHSHSTSNKKEWKKTLMKDALRPFSKLYANTYFCCTEWAGRWLFGNNTFNKGKVTVINNAISLEKFIYNEYTRENLRKELNLDNKLVIGHVGRFVEQKNHRGIIDMFNEIHNINKDSILMLIGDGPLEQEMKDKIKSLSLEDSVLFIGVTPKVNEYMQAMDIFLFPSLYEGLGMVLIEGQVSGLPCITSTEVPKSAKICDKIEFINLNDAPEIWAQKTLDIIKNYQRVSQIENARNHGFDITVEAKKLEEIYSSLIK